MFLPKSGSSGIRKQLCLYLFVAVFIAQSGHASQDNTIPVEDFVIERIQIILPPETDTARWESIARNLIYIEEGEPFSDIRFSQSVNALNRSGLFKSIDIPDPDWAESPLTLTFRLEPYYRIKDIQISGGFPLLEQEIGAVMTVYNGDPYIPAMLDEQREYIRELFMTEGYIDPEVTLTAERDPEDGHYILHVDIDKGDYYEITRVRVRGNENFSAGRLLFRLSTWQSSLLIGGATRLVDNDLEEDEQRLRQFYWSKDYCEARIDSKISLDAKRERARINFDLTEGPRYDLSITGNTAFWNFTLNKDVLIFEEGNINDFNLRRSIRNIETRYRESGYLDVRINRIDKRREENGQPVRSIELAIDEGPRYIVENVVIQGNDHISAETITEQMLTAPPGFLYAGQYVPATLNEDVAAIRSLYRQRGYLSPRVTTQIETRRGDDEGIIHVDILVGIQEGPRTRISDIRIENLSVFDEQEAMGRLSIEPDALHRETAIQESRTVLAANISERGYPHVRINTESIISADGTASEIIFRVNEGPYVEMGETFYVGNFLTRRNTLHRQSILDRNEPFSLADMLESQRNIRNINALSTARFRTIGLEEQAERVTLIAEVTERKPYFFQLSTGYDTSRQLYFNTGVGTINLFGRNKGLRSFVELSMIGYRGEIGYTEPNLFNTRILADAIIFTEDIEELNQNFGVRSSGAAVNLSRPLTPTISASLSFLYDYRDQYRTDDTPIDPDDLAQFRSRSILVTTPGILYDTSDSFVRPTSGIRVAASVDISRGLDNDLDDFFKYRLNVRYYYTPARRLTFAVQGQLGYIDPYGSIDTVAEDQLFFLGGTTDVRGYSENRLRIDENRNPVGGRTAIMGSLEARYNLWRNFELATFYDSGTIRNTLTDAGSGDWRSGVGLGLRYHTPIGPIGLMYGWKIDRRENESPGAWHFTIGYTF